MQSSIRCLFVIAAVATCLPAQAPAAKKPAAKAEPAPAQSPAAEAFANWLHDYKAGTGKLGKDGKTDDAAVAALDAKMAALAQVNTLEAGKLLFDAVAFDPESGGATTSTEVIDRYRDMQPWRVQAMGAKHLRGMTAEGLLPWLLQMLSSTGIRSAKKTPDVTNAAAVLRVLGGHPSLEAKLELMKACRSMPVELRVRAVAAMAKDPTLDLVPALLELLHDGEPNVRIAAANAIGVALQPHVDETLEKKPGADVITLRDQAFTKLEELLQRDAIWQVRSAAAYALAITRCKAAIPVLIRGLDAELQRKKDPWAMDVRLHRLLEGLTGQKVVRGSIEPWKAFWASEGPTFAVKPAAKAGQPEPTSDKYEKFFNIEVESDRVLFVLDFSGSMAEPVRLKVRTTAVAAGVETTKAALVIEEMKRLIMGLPDGALVNLIVFSDGVRMWRQDGGRPALVKLDDDARDDLLGNFLDSLRPAGPTNLHDALATALDFGGRGLHDKYYAAGFDTLYVITDGAPTAGPVVDKDEIRRRVREQNALRKIAINCITFGDQNDTAFLEPLAAENGGRYIHVE